MVCWKMLVRLFRYADLRTTLVLLPLDLMFRVIVYFPAATMWTLGHPERRNAAFTRIYLDAVPLGFVWIAAFVWILAPIARWQRATDAGTVTPDRLRAAIAAANRAPQRLTLAYSLQWCGSTLFAYDRLRGDLLAAAAPAGAWTSLGLAIAQVALGSAALAFTLTSWQLGRVTNDLAAAARSAEMAMSASTLQLRQRVGLIAVLIGVAPACWVAALACCDHFSAPADGAEDAFSTLLPFVLVGCIVFALLCAWMFAQTLISPVARMRAVMADIVQRGEVSQVDRLPVAQRDEIGALAEGVNAMLDRLERVERARREIAVHLAGMNHQLEAQVQQRTQSLEDTNAQLRREIGERERIELELRLAQKLEAIGRIASGVAHEINTPVQYVTDSLQFVRDSMHDLQPLIEKYRELHLSVARGLPATAAADETSSIAEHVDLDYVLANLAPALTRSLDGLGRVATIVRSMKEFAHLDRAAADVDLNQMVTATLEVARHEYKYVADVVTELGELPAVRAYSGELGQVVLNLVVNAAHAIGDVVGSSGSRGKILVKTWADVGHVWFSISDTGGGIPESIRGSIFDPFFTTKEVGRGTGQGLAIVNSVVNKHRGDVRFTTCIGQGTTFTVRLPTGVLA